jgi:hypothetical protein
MISFVDRINAFSALGKFLRQFGDSQFLKETDEANENLNELFYERMVSAIHSSVHYNGWFTEENVRNALGAFAFNLEMEKLQEWLKPYSGDIENPSEPLRVGVIMAGNIPLAGFHDFLCVLISGNSFVGKLSSSDKILLPLIAEVLIEIEPEFKNRVIFSTGRIDNINAVIATGSNNTSRYFEYYFGKYPNIIRRNRNSVAVLTGNETPRQLYSLGEDIFQYFGLGCRNVSKIYVPEGYEFDKFFTGIFEHQKVANNHKYANNYDFNKTVYLLNNVKLLDNGFLLLKEDSGTSSPVSTLFYEYYSDKATLEDVLKSGLLSELQCIVSEMETNLPVVGFGQAQSPKLSDYADGVDTMKFLLEAMQEKAL